jgi:hypothetical protein
MAKTALRGSTGRPSPARAVAATTDATFASGSRSSDNFPVDTSARRKGHGLLAETGLGLTDFFTVESPGSGIVYGAWLDPASKEQLLPSVCVAASNQHGY